MDLFTFPFKAQSLFNWIILQHSVVQQNASCGPFGQYKKKHFLWWRVQDEFRSLTLRNEAAL